MKIAKVASSLETSLSFLTKAFALISVVSIMGMAVIVVINVFGRLLFEWPLPGTMELVELLMVPTCFFAMPYTAILRGHVRIDLIFRRQTRSAQQVLGGLGYFFCLVIWGIISYRSIALAEKYLGNMNLQTSVTSIPFGPFRLIAVVGGFLLCLILVVLIFRPLPPLENQRGGHAE